MFSIALCQIWFSVYVVNASRDGEAKGSGYCEKKSKQQLQILTKYCCKGHRDLFFIILTYNFCCKKMDELAGLMQHDKLILISL